jgi:hypothetical protein
MQVIYRVAAQLEASLAVLSFTELVNYMDCVPSKTSKIFNFNCFEGSGSDLFVCVERMKPVSKRHSMEHFSGSRLSSFLSSTQKLLLLC